MDMIAYDLRNADGSWRLHCNSQLICVSLNQEAAINIVAAMHRRLLKNEEYAHLNLLGIELDELRNSRVLDVSWKRKGPPIQLEHFTEAESFLDQSDSVWALPEAHCRYEQALADEDFDSALDQLILLGDRLRLPSQYWRVLQSIISFSWPNPQIVPQRKERGQLETKIRLVDRRALGDWEWAPKLAIVGYLA